MIHVGAEAHAAVREDVGVGGLRTIMLTWRPGNNFPPGELTIGVRVACSGELQMAKHMAKAGRVRSVAVLMMWIQASEMSKENPELQLV